MRRRGPDLLSLLLGLSPTLIALLWVAGVARFRHYDLSGREWAVVVAFALVLHLLSRRVLRPRPLPPLPPGSSPPAVALLAAAILGALAAVVGGVFEWVVEPLRPSDAGWALRTAWHGACAFGACYCAFLRRLSRAPRPGGG
jgi:H+/Cl- antiporter ClcA